MRALLITNDFPPMTGGEATWYSRVCAAVTPDKIVVLAPSLPGANAFDQHQAYRIVRRWAPVTRNPLGRLIQIVLFFLHGAGLVRRERVAAVHIGHLYLGLVGLGIKAATGTPYVLYLHGGEMAPYLRLPAIRRIVCAIVGHAAMVVVNSAYTQHQYESLGLSLSQVVTLTMGVDTRRFRPDVDGAEVRARYGLDGAKVILTVGRLVERKGHDMVIRALPRLQEAVGPVRYLIVGAGPEIDRLRTLARDLGCAATVVFTGRVREDELPQFYCASDIFAMPNRNVARRDGVEGFGIVFLEAGATGRPVIGGRAGGVADAVVDGTTGILVDAENERDVAAALTRLLRDPDECMRLGRAGRQRAEQLESAWALEVARLWNEPLATQKGTAISRAG